LKTVREFFEARGFIEAATPTLVASPGTEPFLDPFETEWVFGSARHKFFLPTSPEFHLKKMLSFGWTRVFELKTCFRNGELSPSHQAEFLMLEWYRAYATLDAIADDVGALLDFLLMRLNPSHGIQKLTRTTMADLFAKAFAGFELRSTTSIDELRELAKSQAVHFDPTDSWDDVFLRIFIEKIEDKLGAEGPLLVRGYPPSQAALSRIAHNGFADRFEVYWRGLELANAFHELNDPIENQVRFKKDAELKAQLGKAAVPGDLKLLEAFESGMPPAGGIALGVERLFMALFEIQDISETRAFPLSSM
jgi:lysyl-tRNA synthetase class 2